MATYGTASCYSRLIGEWIDGRTSVTLATGLTGPEIFDGSKQCNYKRSWLLSLLPS